MLMIGENHNIPYMSVIPEEEHEETKAATISVSRLDSPTRIPIPEK